MSRQEGQMKDMEIECSLVFEVLGLEVENEVSSIVGAHEGSNMEY